MPRDAATTAAAALPEAQRNAAHAGDGDGDWEQFQAFVAEVEKDDEGATAEKEGDDTARDAEQSLENMAYVDRYRQALEQAAATATMGHQIVTEGATTNGTKRERSIETEDQKEEEEEEESVSTIVRAAALESAKRRRLEQDSAKQSDDGSGSDGDESDDLDLSNWRSKRIA